MYLLLLGPPGVGKGTQGALLAKHYNLPLISSSTLIRQSASPEMLDTMHKGEYVDDGTVIKIVKSKLKSVPLGWILDGFPRTLVQAKKLEDFAPNTIAILLTAIPTKSIQRIVGRHACQKCGATTTDLDKPCKQCGSPTIKRKDDSLEIVQTRLKLYQQKTQLTVDFYKSRGNLISISTNNRSKEETFDKIVHGIEEILVKKEHN